MHVLHVLLQLVDALFGAHDQLRLRSLDPFHFAEELSRHTRDDRFHSSIVTVNHAQELSRLLLGLLELALQGLHAVHHRLDTHSVETVGMVHHGIVDGVPPTFHRLHVMVKAIHELVEVRW